jgi:hypothetical protein
MNTSKTLDLKVFRMNTYKKGEGGRQANPPFQFAVDPNSQRVELGLCDERRFDGWKVRKQFGKPGNLQHRSPLLGQSCDGE